MEDGSCLEQIRNWIRGEPDAEDDLDEIRDRRHVERERRPGFRRYDPRRWFLRKGTRPANRILRQNPAKVPSSPEAPKKTNEANDDLSPVTFEEVREALKRMLECHEEFQRLTDLIRTSDEKLEEVVGDTPVTGLETNENLVRALVERQNHSKARGEVEQERQKHEQTFASKASKAMETKEAFFVSPDIEKVVKPYLEAWQKFWESQSRTNTLERRVMTMKKRLASSESANARRKEWTENNYWVERIEQDEEKLKRLETLRSVRFDRLCRLRNEFLHHISVKSWAKENKAPSVIMRAENYRNWRQELVRLYEDHDNWRGQYSWQKQKRRSEFSSTTAFDQWFCKQYHDTFIAKVKSGEKDFEIARDIALLRDKADLLSFPWELQQRLYVREFPGFIPDNRFFPGGFRSHAGDVQKCDLEKNGLYDGPPTLRREDEDPKPHRWADEVVKQTHELRDHGFGMPPGRWPLDGIDAERNKLEDLASVGMWDSITYVEPRPEVKELIEATRGDEGPWSKDMHKAILRQYYSHLIS